MRSLRVFRVLLLPVSLVFGACAAPPGPNPSECSVTAVDPPVDEPASDCVSPVTGCKRYYLPLLGDLTNPVLRAKYKTAFGSACYVAAANDTFGCWYKEEDVLGPQNNGEGQACKDAKNIGNVSGLAKYDAGYWCKKVPNTDDYSVQVGPDVANVLYIKLGDAPLETSLIDIDGGAPLEINGPYRNLPVPSEVAPGNTFHCAKINGVKQWDVILQANRNAHMGEIHSDLAGFKYPCKDDCGKLTICTEPLVLMAPDVKHPDAARVHHEVRRKDLRSCDWGSNANSNAAVISRRLNGHLYNNYPLKQEVEQINKVPPYTYTP